MNTSERLEIPPLQHRVRPAGWQMRLDQTACCRVAAQFGCTDLIATHSSARLPID